MGEKNGASEEKANDTDKNGQDKRKSGFTSGLEALAIIPQISLSIAIPIVLGAAAGNWIDKKLGTGVIFFVILLGLGIAGGFVGAYRQVNALNKRKK